MARSIHLKLRYSPPQRHIASELLFTTGALLITMRPTLAIAKGQSYIARQPVNAPLF